MHPLNLMTWNVRYFGHGTGGLRASDAWMHRLAGAVATLDPLPDVIALQEVEDRSLRAGMHPLGQHRRFLRALNEARGTPGGWHGMYFPAHRYAVPGFAPAYTTGLAVLVGPGLHVERHNAELPHDITHVRLRAFRALKQRRVAAHVRIRARGGTLDLFNTHLSLPAFLEVGPHRVPVRMGHGTNQLHEAQALLRYVGAQTVGSAVIVGDFNSAPGSPVYRAILEAGLVDGFAAARGFDHDDLHDWHTAAFRDQRMHIDHVFATPCVRWLDFGDHQIDTGPLGGLSDHAPKIGRLMLRTAA